MGPREESAQHREEPQIRANVENDRARLDVTFQCFLHLGFERAPHEAISLPMVKRQPVRGEQHPVARPAAHLNGAPGEHALTKRQSGTTEGGRPQVPYSDAPEIGHQQEHPRPP